MALPKNVRSIANLGDLAINELRDINFGNRLKSGDTTILKYHIRDGDGPDDEHADLSEYQATAVLKYKGIEAYSTEAEVKKEKVPDSDVEGWVVRFWIDEILKADHETPYNVEIVLTKNDEADGRLIFPSDNDQLVLFIESSSLSAETEAVDALTDDRLGDIARNVFEQNPIFVGAQQAEEKRILTEKQRQEAEQERQRKEQERLSAEEGRLTAEKGRVEAEQARTEREDERSESEQNRQTQERKRAQAESARASAEKSRESSYATLKDQVKTTLDSLDISGLVGELANKFEVVTQSEPPSVEKNKLWIKPDNVRGVYEEVGLPHTSIIYIGETYGELQITKDVTTITLSDVQKDQTDSLPQIDKVELSGETFKVDDVFYDEDSRSLNLEINPSYLNDLKKIAFEWGDYNGRSYGYVYTSAVRAYKQTGTETYNTIHLVNLSTQTWDKVAMDGEKGDPGEKMSYSDLTESDKADLRQGMVKKDYADETFAFKDHTHPEYALKSEVPKIVSLTQSEYDSLSKKDDNTLYLVVD